MLLVYVTVPTKEEAKNIADKVVEERLAACANILPGMESVYWWKDELCHDIEVVLIFKTPEKNFEALESKIKALHSYECPCIIALPIVKGSQDYLNWLAHEAK